MLNIRQDQYDVMLQVDPERFVEYILRYISEEMPEEIRGIPLHLVRGMISVAIHRARIHGLTGDSQIMGFIGVMFEIAPNFDEEPVLRTLLSDRRLSPGERWEALFADTALLRAAWKRAARPEFYDERAWVGTATSGALEQ